MEEKSKERRERRVRARKVEMECSKLSAVEELKERK
jgi:hypothetical protein